MPDTPDVKLRAQVYKDPRPAETFAPFHERTRDHGPEWIYEVVRVVTMLNALITFRTQGYGTQNVPNGPVILAPNHASFMDHFFAGAFIRRHVHFMAKSQMFGRSPMSWIYTHGGVFPVRRGHQDEEAFKTAFTVLERGGVVGMYAEGGRTRTGELGQARPGIGRLALESGAAIVPVAILGAHQVRNWRRLRFPRVVVQYGAPFAFERMAQTTRGAQQAAADEILRRIKVMHDEMTELGARRSAQVLRERNRAALREAEARRGRGKSGQPAASPDPSASSQGPPPRRERAPA
jgi:1-acyl-sn-glycerol-3-phosphate acyltransferase